MGKSNLKSICCNAEVKLSGEATNYYIPYYICQKCHQIASIYVARRKTWTRNPATQVQPDKRQKNKKLFTNKEIKEFLKGGDF